MRASALVALLLASAPAFAERCPGPPGAAELEQVDSERRIQFLTRTLASERNQLNIWSFGWGGIAAAGTLGQGIAAVIVQDRGVRADLVTATVATGIGAAFTLIVPLSFAARVAQVERASTSPDRCQLLALSELALDEGAASEALGSSWLPHVGSLLVNGGVLLVLGFGYGRWTSGAISATVGMALSEATLWTRPVHLRDARRRYLSGRPWQDTDPITWSVAPMLGEGTTGVIAALRF